MKRLATALAPFTLVSVAAAQGAVGELAPPNQNDILFGFDITVEGDWAAVASRRFPNTSMGRVFIYQRSAGQWLEVQELAHGITGQPELSFGSSLDMDGGRLAVGAPGYDASRGAVFLYELVNDTFELDTLITLPTLTQFDGFGLDVDLDGDRMAVGFSSDGPGGAEAMVLEEGPSGWSVYAAVTAPFGSYNYGGAVALDGPRLVLGIDDYDCGATVGAYREQGGTYVLQEQLVHPNGSGTFDGYFGSALALEGDRLLVGSRLFGNGGAVFAYVDTPSGWEQEGERLRIPGGSNLNFGESVELRGPMAVIGAATSLGGAFYTFHREGGNYLPTGRFDPVPAPGYNFGSLVAMDGETLLVASRTLHEDNLPVAVFQMPEHATPYGTCSQGDAPCGNPDPVAGCASSVGVGAHVRVLGSTSIAADDLVFELAPIAPNQFGLLYMGGAPTSQPFGDGLRLVDTGGVGTFRFPVRSSGPTGSITEGPGIVAHAAQNFGVSGTIQIGATWFFQGWFRDPGGPCGAGFNLTHGLSVRFLP